MLDSMPRRPRDVLGVLRRSERSIFWTSFVISLAVSMCWVLATPIFAAPDEPKHAIRAASVARLQILGEERPDIEDELVVDAPRGYGETAKRIACYVFFEKIPASCVRISNDTEIVPLPTAAGRHPPAYYFVTGIPSLVLKSSKSIYLMRIVGALITAAFVAASISSLRRLRDARSASAGLAVALTPLVWFVSGTINPSVPEIAAGVALWACGGVLALQARERIDPVLVRRVAIAAIVLCLSRQLGPLWVAVILAVLAVAAGRDGLKRLIATRAARWWAVPVAVAAASTAAWNVVVRPVDPRTSELMRVTTLEAAQASFEDSFNRYKEFVGWFGWLDTPPTPAMVTLFSVALVGMAVAALAIGRRRLSLLSVVVALGTLATPIVFEALEAHELGYFWQSRYTLPLAVGVPILLGLSLAERSRPEPTARGVGAMAITIAVLVGIVDVLGFAQALRRNTVGYSGALDFFLDPIWHPPLPAWFLLASAIVATVALMYWLVGRGPASTSPARAPHGVDEPATVLS
jgi:hypothetical protein